MFVPAVTGAVEDTSHGFGDAYNIGRRNPFLHQIAHARKPAHSPAGIYGKARFSVFYSGYEPEIVHLGKRTIGTAAAEGDFILPGQVVTAGKGDEVFGHGMSKGGDIENLGGAYTGIGAGHDVSDGIASPPLCW